jgi:hypothetical protein
MSGIVDFLMLIAQGAMTGFFIAVTGWLKKVDETGVFPDFNSSKFASTLIIGALAGVLMAWMGISYDNAVAILAEAGVVTLVEYTMKVIYRWFKAAGYRVVPEEVKLGKVEKVYGEFLSGVVELQAMRLQDLGDGIRSKLEELAKKYEEFLREAEVRTRGYRETYLMDLSGRLCVKQKEIPDILRSGDLNKISVLLDIFGKFAKKKQKA